METIDTCKCGQKLNSIEISDGTGMCMHCELLMLRDYKKREEDQLRKLTGSPIHNKYVKQSTVHGVGCVLNFV